MVSTMEPFWSDNFDSDLLKVVPRTVEALGPAADVQLWTHGRTTAGRLNHPACWNDATGMIAFFGLAPDAIGKPDSYYAGNGQELVECTFLEAVRDAWAHSYNIVVARTIILYWGRPAQWHDLFEPLMYHIRCRTLLEPAHVHRLQHRVMTELSAAADKLDMIRSGFSDGVTARSTP